MGVIFNLLILCFYGKLECGKGAVGGSMLFSWIETEEKRFKCAACAEAYRVVNYQGLKALACHQNAFRHSARPGASPQLKQRACAPW